VQVLNLAAGRMTRGLALDLQKTGAPPMGRHKPRRARATTDRFQEDLGDIVRVHWPDRRVNQELKARLTVHCLVFDELIIGRSAAETGGQDFFKNADQIRIEERHSASGELLEAAYLEQVGGPTNLLERAAALTHVDVCLVPDTHIDHYVRNIRTQR
jgi:hypothetical protein